MCVAISFIGTLQGLQQLEMDLKSLTEALRHSQSYVQTTIKELSQVIIPYTHIYLMTKPRATYCLKEQIV